MRWLLCTDIDVITPFAPTHRPVNPLHLQPDQKGVLIRRVEPTAAVSAVLRPNDVLLAFDGTPIANDGTVPFRSGERISFSYLVGQACETVCDGCVLAWGAVRPKPNMAQRPLGAGSATESPT